MIIGLDVGYSMTKVKTAKGTDIFMSTVEEGINDVNKSAITIEYQGKEYTVGEKTGSFSTDLNKINDITFRLCLFTAIARAMGDDISADIQLVTGLPIDYYKQQKQALINSLEGLRVVMVYDGKPKQFTITKCLVFPQSAGLFILNPAKFEGDNVVVDIGGKTVDVAYFDDITLSNKGTYELGALTLYDKIIQAVKSEQEVSYELLKAENIIRSKTIIKDDKTVDVSELVNRVCKNHFKTIEMNIKNGVKQYETSKRTFIGGGSLLLKDYIPNEVKQDDIFTNAKAFYLVGVDKFES